MSFHQALEAATADARAGLLGNPLFADALAGRVHVPMYIGFLTEAYHHVRHTVPLMMACGARLAPEYEWLRGKLVHYVEEEFGHQEWILSDIAACGGDVDVVREGRPSPATELMVAYAYDLVNRINPVSFFGMVHVLEGTSTALATRAATSIAQSLALPRTAFSYLLSHGCLDTEHVVFFRELVDRIESPKDRDAIVHASRMFYRLYGDVFHHIRQEFLPCISQAAA